MPTLTDYETAVYNLIQAPSSPNALVPTVTVDAAINTARQQLAADAECIRLPATLGLTSGTQSYSFSAIAFAGGSNVLGTISVRLAQIAGARLALRPWEWFTNYYLGNGTTGTPVRLAQQGQGLSGTLFFDPTPNSTFTVNLDVVAIPVVLTSPSTPEAIPYPWTDAVAFYAAWLIFINLQRQADANLMLARYKELALRGRQESTPTVLPDNLPGGIGARLAASKTTLTLTQQRPQ